MGRDGSGVIYVSPWVWYVWVDVLEADSLWQALYMATLRRRQMDWPQDNRTTLLPATPAPSYPRPSSTLTQWLPAFFFEIFNILFVFLAILWSPVLFVEARETNPPAWLVKFTDLYRSDRCSSLFVYPLCFTCFLFGLSITSWNVKHERQSVPNCKSPGVNASPCLTVPQQLRQHRPRPLWALIDTLSARRHQ